MQSCPDARATHSAADAAKLPIVLKGMKKAVEYDNSPQLSSMSCRICIGKSTPTVCYVYMSYGTSDVVATPRERSHNQGDY